MFLFWCFKFHHWGDFLSSWAEPVLNSGKSVLLKVICRYTNFNNMHSWVCLQYIWTHVQLTSSAYGTLTKWPVVVGEITRLAGRVSFILWTVAENPFWRCHLSSEWQFNVQRTAIMLQNNSLMTWQRGKESRCPPIKLILEIKKNKGAQYQEMQRYLLTHCRFETR